MAASDDKIFELAKSGSRRSFLKRVWGLLGIAAGVELIWVGSGFFRAGKTAGKNTPKKLVTAGRVADFKAGDVFPFRNGQFYLVRLQDGGFLAVSLKCTHLGCSVIWDATAQTFHCPCHSSVFDQHGGVVHPPAPRPLDLYPVIIEEGMVKIDVNNPQHRNHFLENQIVYA